MARKKESPTESRTSSRTESAARPRLEPAPGPFVADPGEGGTPAWEPAGGVMPASLVGWLTSQSRVGRLVVDFAGNGRGPLPARSTVRLSASEVEAAVGSRQGVLLQFEGGQAHLPIVTGVLEPERSLLDELLAPPDRATVAAPPPVKAGAAAESAPEARVDGRRVVLEGAHEVVLKCGEASITLKRDGKVILKGAYVETHARGLNRIKGATVKIN